MLLALAWQVLFYSNCVSPHVYADAGDYIRLSKNPPLLRGEIDFWRTPGYPSFIAVAQHFSSTEAKALRRVVLAQQIISWISVYCFFYTARSLFKSTLIAAGASLCYACHPEILGFNVSLYSESLAVSGTVFAVWLLVAYLRRPGYGKAVMMGITVFLLIMLRPAFLCFLPIFLLFWTVRLIVVREHRFREMTGLCCAIAALMLVLGYCQLFKTKYGDFALSHVGYINQLFTIIHSGLYRNGSDPVINAKIESRFDIWKQKNPNQAKPDNPWLYSQEGSRAVCLGLWLEEGDNILAWDEQIQYARETIRKNRLQFAKYSLGKFVGIKDDKFETYRYTKYKKPYKQSLFNLFDWGLTFQAVYFLLLLEAVVLSVIFYFTRRIPWFWSVYWLLIAGIIFTAIVGAPNDWQRLVISALPLVILLIAKYADLAVYVVRETCGKKIGEYLKESQVLPISTLVGKG